MAIFLNEDKTEMMVTCHCCCGRAANIKIDVDDSEFYSFLSYVNGNFYRDQCGVFGTLKEKCKKIWSIIRNKDYYYSDVVMTKEEFNIFKEYINQF